MARCGQMARPVAQWSRSRPLGKCAVPESPPLALGVGDIIFSVSAPKQMCPLAAWLCRVRALHLELPVWEPQHGHH